jgi:amidase
MKRLLFALALAAAPLGAAPLDITTATIADIQSAMAKGTLTSEKLTTAYLARVSAFDQQGPAINAVITLNPKALAEAKALDAERKAGKVRGPLHGVPIVLKDNFNTFDLPTSAGSQMLEGSIPPKDATVVKKLRDAGVVIIAKVNLSEFAGAGSARGASPELAMASAVPQGFSSLGLQTLNPHDLTRNPAGSSGGTGASIAAGFAQFGLGTDTGGSIRNPSSANGIVGLKPTHGLLSRSGIVPYALSFDTGGPMARSVYDVAVALGVMTGVDPEDDATKKSEGKFDKDYTKYLKVGSLKGARIGVARDFTGKDAGTDKVFEAAIAKLKSLGATIVDPVNYPSYFLVSKQALYTTVSTSEFKVQIGDYLKTTKPGFPKSIQDLADRSNNPETHYRSPEKAFGLKYTAANVPNTDDPVYLAAKNEGLAAARAIVMSVLTRHKLDALIYPTVPRPAGLLGPTIAAGGADSATNIANLTGFPDLIVPAGVTAEGLPVTISFFGPAFSEAKLLGYGYDFEQATKARILPKNTPKLPSDSTAN